MLCKVFELRGSATLEAVALRHNELDADCVEAIKPGLAMATSLRSLDLSRNYLGDAGASSLVDVLPQLTSLTSLNLAGNAIGETGLLMLAAGVETVRLEHLDLSENVITTPAAVKAVGRCFATPLKKARARSISCESAADTVRHLCTGLQEGLEDLDVSGNRLDKPAMTCLIRALPCAGKSLSRAVVWTRCSFSDEEWCEVLQEAIDTLPLCPLLASLVLSPPVSPAIAALDMKLQQLLAERRT
ncbi:RAN GTPase-activating protein 1 [Diplonema papillatum]|nr:RAN GTPase-activating protein 1 [Diplonema papillatum]